MTKIFMIMFLFFISLGLKAGTIDPGTPDSKYLEYGKKFHSVVKLCGTYEDGSLFCASAVLIDDHNFLTASHVVEGYKICFITIDEKSFEITKIILNPDFKKEIFGKCDIAVGHSEVPFNLDYYPPLYTEEDEVGKICSISGYGLTGTFHTGATHSDNKRRAGSNIIDELVNDLLICSPSVRGKNFTSLEFMTGSGDSGGGLFIDGKLAGINSCIMASNKSPKSKYGEESGHTRVSKFANWIKENRKKN